MMTEDGPGIGWTPGDEDYPFASLDGESALDFFARWLEDAPYARVEQDGVRYIHETDVANVINHITADVGLVRARLGSFGDQVITGEEYDATIQRIEDAVAQLDEALGRLRRVRG